MEWLPYARIHLIIYFYVNRRTYMKKLISTIFIFSFISSASAFNDKFVEKRNICGKVNSLTVSEEHQTKTSESSAYTYIQLNNVQYRFGRDSFLSQKTYERATQFALASLNSDSVELCLISMTLANPKKNEQSFEKYVKFFIKRESVKTKYPFSEHTN